MAGAHTAVLATGWGTSVQQANGGRQLLNPDAQLVQADQLWVEELNPRYCQEISTTTNVQCQAYPVKGTTQCAGHRNAARAKQNDSE